MATTATITYGTTYQTIDGFGVCGCNSQTCLSTCDLAVADKSVSSTAAVAGTFTLSSIDEGGVIVCTYRRSGAVTLADEYGPVHQTGGSVQCILRPTTPAAAGDFLWVAVRVGDLTASTGVAVSDSINGPWNHDAHQDMATAGDSLQVFSFPGSAAGLPVVTISCTEGLDYVADYRRYQGVSASSPFDKSASADSTGTTAVTTGNTAALSQANELVIAAMATDYAYGAGYPLSATPGTGYGNFNQTQFEMPFTAAQADQLFSPTAGIGLSIVRDVIRADTTTGASMNPFNIALAAGYGCKIFATCWSPPAAYKSNGNLCGGSLNSADYAAYGTFLASYVASMASIGLQVYGLSPANEPNQSQTRFASCTYTSATYDSMMQALVSAWGTAGYLGTVRLFLPEESSWDFSYASTALSDGTISADLYGLCAHFYGGSIGGAVSPSAAGGRVWQTEYSNENTFDGSMTNGLTVAVDIHDHLVTAGANAFLYWLGYNEVWDNESLIPDVSTAPAKRYYVLGQWSRFVRPGWVRIGESDSGGTNFYCSAYRDPAGAAFAVVCINGNSTTQAVTITLSGFTPAPPSVTPWVTDSGSNGLTQQADIAVSSGSFSATLTADSVTTFYGNLATGRVQDRPAPGLPPALFSL